MIKSKNIAKVATPLIIIAIVIISWEVMSIKNIIPLYILPTPSSILKALIRNMPVILPHIGSTIIVATVGFICSIIFGTIVAISMDYVKWIQYAMKPFIIISQNIPLIAIAPLFILWFGFGLFPKVLVVILTCFFPITWNIFTGFQEAPDQYSTLLKSMGGKYIDILRYLKVPFTVPYFFAGIRLAATYAVMATIISEWTGGNSGLGIFLIRSKNNFDVASFFAGIIIIIILSLLFWMIIQQIEYIYLRKKRMK